MNDIQEQRAIAVTKLEVKLRKFLEEKKLMILADRSVRREIENVRKKYLLNQDVIDMFAQVDMTTELTNLIKSYNNVLDTKYH